jgi:hypothetical protein
MALCGACKAAGFGECNGPHITDAAIGGFIGWHRHGQYMYPQTSLSPCSWCARQDQFKIDNGPKPTAEDRRLLMLYGITKAEKQKVFKWQNERCFICQRPPVNVALGSDHDHDLGEFRGLLCLRCNKGLSLFGDSVKALKRATVYLTVYPSTRALGRVPIGRVGRSTRKWRTKRERTDRMAWVAERIKELWPNWMKSGRRSKSSKTS